MAAILSHEVLMPLEEVIDEIVYLRVVRLTQGIRLLLLKTLSTQ